MAAKNLGISSFLSRRDAQAACMSSQRNAVRRRRFAIICASLCLLAQVAIAPGAQAVDPGDPASMFDAPALQGSGRVALDDHRGKVIFLDFWASWCPPCLESLPQIERLRNSFPEGEFQVVAVNVDGDPDKARKFLKRHPVSYPSASDPKGLLPKRYALQTMPTSFLIDRSGIVRYVHTGFTRGDLNLLHGRIKQLLEQP